MSRANDIIGNISEESGVKVIESQEMPKEVGMKIEEMIAIAESDIDEDGFGTGGSLTRRHFEALADMIRNTSGRDDLIDALVNWCADSNAGFKSDKFRAVAGIQ
jgi:hypothetical protein